MPLQNHPQRQALHNEIHARPPEPVTPPLAITQIVMLADPAQRDASRAHLAELLRNHHLAPPDAHTNHLRIDLGAFRLRWELHTEFVSYTFMRPLSGDPFGEAGCSTALDVVPRDWQGGLPGQNISSMHLWVLNSRDFGNQSLVQRGVLHDDTLVASTVADGHGEVYTDFAIHADGFSRMVLLVGSIAPRRLGRLVQQLTEIETYRMAALLALPVAREATAALGGAERELAQLADAIRTANRSEEPALLDRLTRLAGQVEGQYASTHSRFSASSAYFELVDRRISDIAESRLAGMQTIREFMQRRLSPAVSTCEWAVRRQQSLSERVSRISNLLRTRVEIEQQVASQELLATMNTRQDLQLKMQSTVEGLSVAAITYYIVGLVAYVAKGAEKFGWPMAPELTAAIAIPVVGFAVWWSLRRLHNRLLKG
ncbi:MAG: DUF3422 domain-containing protein [Pseudomonadota bacterium]